MATTIFGNSFVENYGKMQGAIPDPQLLRDMVTTKMPFGKYSGRLITQLPVSYLEWFERKGFPPGKLGMMLSTMYVIKTNGLEEILRPIIQSTTK